MAHIEICENVLLRYASECGPEGQGGAKGGYLKGHIQVPTCAPGEILKMVLSVFPTQDVIETLEKKMGQQKFYPQPLILYARRMGGKVRQKEMEPVPASYHWRMTFIIEVRDINISHENNSYTLYQGSNVRIVNKIEQNDVKNLRRSGIPTDLRLKNTIVATLDDQHRIHLGGQKEDEMTSKRLSIGVLKPKLDRRRGGGEREVTIRSVLEDMLGEDSPHLAHCQETFTAKNKVNLTRFRIKVNFIKLPSPWASHNLDLPSESAGEATSEDILDTGEWALDLFFVTPRESCLSGGHEITLTSEYDIKKDVRPIFQVYDENDEPCELVQSLNQPKIKSVSSKNDLGSYIGKKTSFILITPAQKKELCLELKEKNLKLKILLKREKYVSQKKFEFKYLDIGYCPYQHSLSLPRIESARPFISKRKVEEGKEEKKNSSPTRPKILRTETRLDESFRLPPISEMMTTTEHMRQVFCS